MAFWRNWFGSGDNGTSNVDTSATQQRASTEQATTQQSAATQQWENSPVRGVQPPPPLLPPANGAFDDLTTDPEGFMKMNQVKVRGQWHQPSGKMDFVMISEGAKDQLQWTHKPSGTRHDVNQYQIMSKADYEQKMQMGSSTIAEAHDVHHFQAQHLAMEQLPQGQGHDSVNRRYQSRARIDASQSQNYVTNPLSGCAIVRQQSTLMHLQPASATGNEDGTFAGGRKTEQSVQQILPDADVFGKSRYTDGTNYWIQNQGSQVNIFGQHTDTQGKNWTSHTSHEVFDELPQHSTSAVMARQGNKLELALKAQIKSQATAKIMDRGRPSGPPDQARQQFDSTLKADISREVKNRKRNNLMNSIKSAPRRNGFTD